MVARTETKAITEHKSCEEEKTLSEMDAIARGVEAKLKLSVGFPDEMVTYETIAIVRQLGINKRTIDKWVARRAATAPDTSKFVQSLSCY